jgi:hypothetical protein
MGARLVFGTTAFLIGVVGIMSANVYVTRMIHEINRATKDGPPLTEFGFTLLKNCRIFRAYRASCPGGRLHVYAVVSVAMGAAGLLCTAICLGIIG